jgi:enoyl-CoA hydratase/carnithine racemase
VPGERLMDEAMVLANRLVEMAPLSLRYFKEMAYRGLEMNVSSIT